MGDEPSPPKTKRSSVACRRCRRLRTKCIHENSRVPCEPCLRAGSEISANCAFPNRGDANDRRFRVKRVTHADVDFATTRRASLATSTAGTVGGRESTEPRDEPRRQTHDLSPILPRRSQRVSVADDVWSLLPPHEELISGCRVFLTTCLQIGFIPKSLFLEQMETDRDSVHVFLLLSMLGISARFTPELCERFQGSKNASEFFLDVAHILIADEMWNTSLENAQAFFLLGMADWGRGDRGRSAINMGIAVRMAAVLRLHREETYQLPPDATADQVVDAERARRTFWVIQNHDNLYAQQDLPLSFSKSDITALLPCHESDFAFGRCPPRRAALAGTPPAQKDPSLEYLPDRSLFATLVQAHDMWGAIARDASRNGQAGLDPEPWQPNSHYMRTAKTLSSWEENIPREHKWSPWNLRGYKAEHVDLAYLSIVTIARLNNIVLRRAYMDRIFRGAMPRRQSTSTETSAPHGFWEQMSIELFSNAWQLYKAVEMWFSLRSNEDGFPAMLAFCIYVCGILASHLHKQPGLCPAFVATPSSQTILHRSLEVLSMFEDKWSTASQWSRVLRDALESGRALDRPLAALSPDGPRATAATDAQAQAATISSPTLVDSPPPILSPHQGGVSGAPNTYTVLPSVEALPDMHFGSNLGQSQYSSRGIPNPFQQILNQDPSVGINTFPLGGSGAPFLHDHPLDIDFSDVIQGYINLGWAT